MRAHSTGRLALQARETVGAHDVSSDATTRLALGVVRAAQGRDDEAEELLRDAVAILRNTGFRRYEVEPLAALAGFLRARGREQEAVAVDEELTALAAPVPDATRA